MVYDPGNSRLVSLLGKLNVPVRIDNESVPVLKAVSSGSTGLDRKSAFVKCRTAIQGFKPHTKRIRMNTRCAAWMSGPSNADRRTLITS